MFKNLRFDELNALVQNKRSMPFEQYFGEMNLTEDDKAERIKIAQELEDNFIVTMTLLFTMTQAGKIHYEIVRKQLKILIWKLYGNIRTLTNIFLPISKVFPMMLLIALGNTRISLITTH